MPGPEPGVLFNLRSLHPKRMAGSSPAMPIIHGSMSAEQVRSADLVQSQPASPAALAALAPRECGDALAQPLHDGPAFGGAHGDPEGDFPARAAATDAETGFRIEDA